MKLSPLQFLLDLPDNYPLQKIVRQWFKECIKTRAMLDFFDYQTTVSKDINKLKVIKEEIVESEKERKIVQKKGQGLLMEENNIIMILKKSRETSKISVA